MSNSFDFILQDDSAADVDLLKGGTHQKIADRLFDLITKSETKGLTVGLEGCWGSGKSTVINLLKKKLEEKEDSFVFYIDSWAHEGDHLRRAFLESFAQQLEKEDVNGNELEKIKNKISNRVITKNITTKPVVNFAGAVCSIFLVFALPIGLLFVDKGVEHLWDGNCPLFKDYLALGLVLSLSPVVAALLFGLANFFINLVTKDEKKSIMPIFWTTDTTEDTTDETTEEPEKTPIEFEKFFEELLEIAKKKGKKRIVCVIDNLDRINAGDALKIWSTLQIFVQSKNPKGCERSSDVWIIVPYDESGLRLLWDKKNNDASRTAEGKQGEKSLCSKSFFDKNFQLRIEVPKMLFEGWEDFAQKTIDKSLIGFDDAQRKVVLDMLKRGRTSFDIAPSPREIKTYVNQVGFLYDLHRRNNISLELLCFYVDLKYLKSLSSDEMKEKLLTNAFLSYNQVLDLFKDREDIKKELSAILFNVEKEKGLELLLVDSVGKALEDKEEEKLRKLVDSHEHAVMLLVEKILANGMYDCTRYLRTLLSVFDVRIEKILLRYIKKHADVICQKISQVDIGNLKCLFEIICKNSENLLLQQFSKSLVESQQNQLKSAAGNQAIITDAVDKISAIYDIVKNSSLIYIDYASLGIEIFNQIAESVDVEKMPKVGEIVKNVESLDESVSKIIAKTSQTMPNLPRKLIRLGCCFGLSQWNSTLAIIDALIVRRTGYSLNKVTFKQCVQILSIMQDYRLQNESALIKRIVKKLDFWHYMGANNDAEIRKTVLYLLTKYFDGMALPLVGSVSPIMPTVNSVKAMINQKDDDVTDYFCKKINATYDARFIWALANDSKRQLIGSIIEKQLKDEQHWFFRTNKPFEYFTNAMSYFNDEKLKKQLLEEFKTQADSEYGTSYADGFVEYIVSKCNEEKTSCIKTDVLSALYDCMKDSFKIYVSEKIVDEILKKEFIFSSNLKGFVVEKIIFSSLSNRGSDVAVKIKNLVDGKKWDALEFALLIIKKCNALKPPQHYTDVMRQPLKDLDAKATSEQKRIIEGLCDFFCIDKVSVQN